MTNLLSVVVVVVALIVVAIDHDIDD